jgi:hypothetical protein
MQGEVLTACPQRAALGASTCVSFTALSIYMAFSALPTGFAGSVGMQNRGHYQPMLVSFANSLPCLASCSLVGQMRDIVDD